MVNPTVPAGLSAREKRGRAVVLPPAFKARIWRPGESGNPQGKSGRFQEVQRICREASPDAARKLIELMNDDDPRIAGWAADKVLERAWGKPKEYDPRMEQPDPPRFDPSQFTAEELGQVKKAMLLLMSKQVGADGESGYTSSARTAPDRER